MDGVALSTAVESVEGCVHAIISIILLDIPRTESD
jgi:hypothetical protein